MDKSDAAFLGFLFGILVAMVVIFACLGMFDNHPCEEGRAMLQEIQIRIMVEDRLSAQEGGVCRFATDEGFVLYHDGQLYFEAGDGE